MRRKLREKSVDVEEQHTRRSSQCGGAPALNELVLQRHEMSECKVEILERFFILCTATGLGRACREDEAEASVVLSSAA